MKESPVKIDALLEPLLIEGDDGRADDLLVQLINVHANPVIKGVIRFKLRLNSARETHALKNRLHYLLTRQRGFDLWQHDDGKSIAGFAKLLRQVQALQTGSQKAQKN